MFNLLETRTYNEFPPEPVGWLWEPYLARGKLAVLDGDPGIGKTLLALDLAARLSRGGPLPGGKSLDRPHTTLLLTADDPAADTVRPRLEAAGADLDRVFAAFPESSSPSGCRRTSTPWKSSSGSATPTWSSSTRSPSSSPTP